jgi:hypothetical protein
VFERRKRLASLAQAKAHREEHVRWFCMLVRSQHAGPQAGISP